jgi:hypothetical protein
MAWCERHRVDFIFGLAKNARLVAAIESELAAALRRVPLVDARQLVTSAARAGEGGVDRR